MLELLFVIICPVSSGWVVDWDTFKLLLKWTREVFFFSQNSRFIVLAAENLVSWLTTINCPHCNFQQIVLFFINKLTKIVTVGFRLNWTTSRAQNSQRGLRFFFLAKTSARFGFLGWALLNHKSSWAEPKYWFFFCFGFKDLFDRASPYFSVENRGVGTGLEEPH